MRDAPKMCGKGLHAMVGHNVMVCRKGHSRCRACHNQRTREYERRKARAAAPRWPGLLAPQKGGARLQGYIEGWNSCHAAWVAAIGVKK